MNWLKSKVQDCELQVIEIDRDDTDIGVQNVKVEDYSDLRKLLKEGTDIKVIDRRIALPFKVKKAGDDFIQGRFYESYIDKSTRLWQIPSSKQPYEVPYEDFIEVLKRKTSKSKLMLPRYRDVGITFINF